MSGVPEPAIGVSGGRRAAARPARAAAGKGRARKASRQWSEATSPITGMPTIHAAGAPARARLTIFVRSPGVLHEAVAATPAATSIAIPPHIGTCARARSSNVGATALAREPTARRELPAPMSARGEKRERARPVASATPAASGAARMRNWPASAIETPKSDATRPRIGDITRTPAWLAKSARKSTRDGVAPMERCFVTPRSRSPGGSTRSAFSRSRARRLRGSGTARAWCGTRAVGARRDRRESGRPRLPCETAGR